MATFQILGIQRFDTKMDMHTSKHNDDVSLVREFQKHLSNASHKHGIVYHGKHKKRLSKKVKK